MKTAKHYTRAPKGLDRAIEQAIPIEDFLPPPEKLIIKEDEVKITINLSNKSIQFFKKQSQKTGVPYQKMIKRILDIYTERYV